MTVQSWLAWACEDARRRSIDDAVPVIEALGRAAETLRAAAWDDVRDDEPSDSETVR
jgi:hypothetical protein